MGLIKIAFLIRVNWEDPKSETEMQSYYKTVDSQSENISVFLHSFRVAKGTIVKRPNISNLDESYHWLKESPI